MSRKDDGALSVQQCNEIHDDVWRGPATAGWMAYQLENFLQGAKAHRDSILGSVQRGRRTRDDLDLAERRWRMLQVAFQHYRQLAKQERNEAEFKKLGIDPANPNPDGSDFNMMSAIEAKSEEPPSQPEVRSPAPAEEEAFLDL